MVFKHLLSLLPLILVIVRSSAGTRDYILSERANDDAAAAAAADTELIDELVLNSADVQSFVEKLSHLRGRWPANDRSECDAMNTRDMDYITHGTRRKYDVRKLLNRVETCGLASQFNDKSSPASETRTSRDLRRRTKRHSADALNQRKPYIDADWLTQRDGLDVVDLSERELEVVDETVSSQGEKEKDDSLVTRVVGGNIIPSGSWPWLAAIGLKGNGPRCGGTLIDSKWVMTAAHCFEDREEPCKYNIRLGSRSWFYDDANTHVDVTVEAIYRHPEYSAATHLNDIALLRLSKPVELSATGPINAICLPPRSKSVDLGTVCMAAGWGKTAEVTKASVYEAREVEIPVITYNGNCGNYPKDSFQESMVCAGYLEGGRDTCQGDSGGPLAYRKKGRWTQLGLTSFGEGCARANYPGVYTDIGAHLRWIASVTERF